MGSLWSIKCVVKPQGGGILKIKGLRQGNTQVLLHNVPYPWALPIVKHKANRIMKLNIQKLHYGKWHPQKFHYFAIKALK
jgi:hypothetical protein